MGLSVGVSSTYILSSYYWTFDLGNIMLSSSLGLKLCLLIGKCEFVDQIGARCVCLVSDTKQVLNAHCLDHIMNTWSVKVATF